MKTTKEVLRALGINRTYTGYYTTVRAVELVQKEEYRLSCITKMVYEVIAEEKGCTWYAVERGIRTVIQKAWRINSVLLSEMAGYELEKAPTAAEFIEMLSNYCVNNT